MTAILEDIRRQGRAGNEPADSVLHRGGHGLAINRARSIMTLTKIKNQEQSDRDRDRACVDTPGSGAGSTGPAIVGDSTMPISWHFDRGKRLVVAKLSGTAEIEDFRATLREIVASDECPSDTPALWDARAFDFGALGRDFQERLAQAQKDFPERGAARIGVVVADDLGFGMMRMYQAIAHDLAREIRVFRDIADAEQWLAGR